MKTEQNFILSFSWIATVGYFIVGPFLGMNTLATVFWVSAILLDLILCITNFKLIPEKTKIICFLLTVIMLCSMLIGNKLFSKSHYVSLICMVNSLLSISLYSNITISKKTKIFIKICGISIALLFTYYSFTPIAHKVIMDGISTVSDYFVFNLGNANLAGIYLFLIFSIIFIFSFDARNLFVKLFYIALDAYIVYMIFRTGARSCIIAVIALIAVGIWYGNRKTSKLVIYVATIFPIAFIYILASIYNNGYQDITVLGKSIYTGREGYFKSCIDGIDSFLKWVFGDFAGWGLNNAHNSALAILLSLGIVGLVLVYIVYYDTIFKMNSNTNKSRARTICVVSILCLFVESIAEAALFLGGFPGVNFICTMVVLSKESTEEIEERENSISKPVNSV